MSEKLMGVDTSRALDLSKGGSSETVTIDYDGSIYTRSEYTLELRYTYIVGLSMLMDAINAKSESVQARELCVRCREMPYDHTMSKGAQILHGRISRLTKMFGDLVLVEEQHKKWAETDAEERHQIGLEIVHTIKKLANIRGLTAQINIVDKFNETQIIKE